MPSEPSPVQPSPSGHKTSQKSIKEAKMRMSLENTSEERCFTQKEMYKMSHRYHPGSIALHDIKDQISTDLLFQRFPFI